MITVCPNDEELLAVASGEEPSAELQSHLRECNRCNRKVGGLRVEVKELQKAFDSSHGAVAPAGREAPTISVLVTGPLGTVPLDSEPAPAMAQPAKIGKYLVLGTLGSGGQATVYRAMHPTLDEQVVIKLSSRSLAGDDPGKNDRLFSEGRVLCQLKHPNIGRVYDLDIFENRPYLVMEYVQGRTLDQYVRDSALTAPRIAAMMARLLRALNVAHRCGVVHQDIKPQNIIIDQRDEPRLIDFGMARLSSAWSEHNAQPVGGTLQYMPPEQAQGKADQISGRSDIFAMGAVLYFLLTGKPPIRGNTRSETLQLAAKGEIDEAALQQAAAPRGLKQIARKAMSVKAEDRFATAEDMAAALESFGRGTKRNRLLVRLGLPLLIGVMVGLGWLWMRPPPFPPSGQLLITPDGRGSLDNLPLVTGQKLKIDAKVPANYPAVLFWIGPNGKVFRRPSVQIRGGDSFDHVISPAPNLATPLQGPAGTEFLLVVAGPGLDDEKNVEALQSELEQFFSNHSLKDLPPTGAVLVDASGTQVRFLDGGDKPRDPGAEEPDSCANVTQPLDALVQKLKDKGYFFAGIAVPHENAGP